MDWRNAEGCEVRKTPNSGCEGASARTDDSLGIHRYNDHMHCLLLSRSRQMSSSP